MARLEGANIVVNTIRMGEVRSIVPPIRCNPQTFLEAMQRLQKEVTRGYVKKTADTVVDHTDCPTNGRTEVSTNPACRLEPTSEWCLSQQ